MQLHSRDVEFLLARLRSQASADPEDDAHLAFLGSFTLRDLVGTDSPFEPLGSDDA